MVFQTFSPFTRIYRYILSLQIAKITKLVAKTLEEFNFILENDIIRLYCTFSKWLQLLEFTVAGIGIVSHANAYGRAYRCSVTLDTRLKWRRVGHRHKGSGNFRLNNV